MKRGDTNTKSCNDENAIHMSSVSQGDNENTAYLHHEIVHVTKLRSEPHKLLTRTIPGFSNIKLPVSTVKMLVGREVNISGRGKFSSADSCHMLSRYLPINGPWKVDLMKSRVYVSQFSADGSLFVAGFQGSQIKIYNVDKDWQVQKDIKARSMNWTITDTSLSSDKRFLVYASITPIVHIVDVRSETTESIANITEIHEGLDFSGDDDEDDEFGIFSVNFSSDGRELVAGGNDSAIYVYDLEARERSLRIPAHESDVNAVCFADEANHLIFSGSDDHLCKVWDRRCFVARGQAAGVMIGHLEGVTCIDSRGDGRYFISNGKDQTTKLWDLRKMSSNATYSPKLRDNDWDYRWMEYPPHARTMKHPNDQSLYTYRGHSVLCTLIRCYFSPVYSTSQKYIYTGSSDGSVYIYDMVTGAEVARLDYHQAAVRDCSWHPIYPMMVSSSWDGTIARWEFSGNGEALPRRRSKRRRALM